jgi:hypothetical protein
MPQPPAESIGDQLNRLGWLQGHLLKPEDAQALGLECGPGDLYILASQSCDVVHQHDDGEPTIELIKARHIESANRNYEDLKSPRVLHITHDGIHLELRAHDRCLIPRAALADFKPGQRLELVPLRNLQRFLARRYDRAALADEFNRRYDGNLQLPSKNNAEGRYKKIKDVFTRINERVVMILLTNRKLNGKETSVEVDLQPWENNGSDDNAYVIGVVLVTKTARDQDALEDDKLKLETLLNSCPGINAKVGFLPVNELTYDKYLVSVRWDLDAVSARVGLETPKI